MRLYPLPMALEREVGDKAADKKRSWYDWRTRSRSVSRT